MSEILSRTLEIDQLYYDKFDDYPPSFGMLVDQVIELYTQAELAVQGTRGIITAKEAAQIKGAPLKPGADY